MSLTDDDIKKIDELIATRLSNVETVLRTIKHKIEDLELAFRNHLRWHELTEEHEDDSDIVEPIPSLGGIVGGVDPSGRFARW
jgi:hypothetical protein